MKKQEDFDDFLVSLGRTIKKHREEAGLTQEQLAKAIGSESKNDTRSYISKMEKGQRNPPASVLKRLSEVLGVSACDLLNEAQNIQKEVQACELFEQCYGSDVFKVVQKFLKLDHIDRIKAEERIDTLLDSDKYAVEKGSSEDMAM